MFRSPRSSFGNVVDEQGVEIGLERLDGVVEGLAHRHPEELVEHGAVGRSTKPLDFEVFAFVRRCLMPFRSR